MGVGKAIAMNGFPNTAGDVRARLVASGDCLLWPGAIHHGQPVARLGGQIVPVRRLLWREEFGEPPARLVRDCGEPRCCRPSHMRPGGARAVPLPKMRERCAQGHLLTPDNVEEIAGGIRLCKECGRTSMSRFVEGLRRLRTQ